MKVAEVDIELKILSLVRAPAIVTSWYSIVTAPSNQKPPKICLSFNMGACNYLQFAAWFGPWLSIFIIELQLQGLLQQFDEILLKNQ